MHNIEQNKIKIDLTTRIKNWFYVQVVTQKLYNITGVFLFAIVSIIFAFIIVKVGTIAGISLLGGLIGLPIIYIFISRPNWGLFIIVGFSFIIPTLVRISSVPFGLLLDISVFITLFAVLIKKKDKTLEGNNSGFFSNPISYIFVIWKIYVLLQIFNPNVYGFNGITSDIRGVLMACAFYFVAMDVFKDFKNIINFTKIWVILALCAAIYGLHQEYVGLLEFEVKWLYSNEQVLGLNTIGGRIRKWSFLSDVTSFGMFMAFSSLFCFVLVLGPFSKFKKSLLVLFGCLMIYSMVYSLARTAYAMVPIGFLFLFLININNKKTLIFSTIILTIGVGILMGPFYSGPLNRIRSTFQPTEDASYTVRDNNRATIQPYIHSHPFGGGVNTTGLPGKQFHPYHPLAGFAPDNGYLRTALEQGWVGLLIFLSVVFMTLVVGIKNYYTVQNPLIKILYAGYLVSFFSLSIANYAQVAIGQLPMGFIFGATYALAFRLKQFDDTKKPLTI